MIKDADNANVLYLEATLENFEGALEHEDWELGNEIAADLFDKGFKKESMELGRRLLVAKMSVKEEEPEPIDWRDYQDARGY